MPNSTKSDCVSITLLRGSLYIGEEIYQRYFARLDAVILLERDGHLYIMPVRNTSGGGYLLKLKNSAGDRIINAMDFFRERGLDNFDTNKFEVTWDQDMAALKATDFLKTAN